MKSIFVKQPNLADGLQQLIELNFDAIEAYDRAMKSVSTSKHIIQLQQFKQDHERHIRNISSFMRFFQSLPEKNWQELSSIAKIKAFLSPAGHNKEEENGNSIFKEEVEILIKDNLKDEKRRILWFKEHEKDLLHPS